MITVSAAKETSEALRQNLVINAIAQHIPFNHSTALPHTWLIKVSAWAYKLDCYSLHLKEGSKTKRE